MIVFGFGRNLVAGAILVALCLMETRSRAQEEAEDSPFRPGLIASYVANGQTAKRVDEVVAFDWQDAAPDERLPAGGFTATWQGRLWARGAGEYRLYAYVQGEVTIKLAGKAVLEGQSEQPGWLESSPLVLDFDHHPIEVTYHRATPRGQLKLFWTGPDFRLEPLPAWALVHERESSPSVEFERGRHLATALRCAACHRESAASMVAAPALDRLSGNINDVWLVEWLASHGDAASGDRSRRMPDLGVTREEAQAVAAWLLREPAVKNDIKANEQKEAKVAKEENKNKKSADSKGKKKGEEKPKPSVEEGEKLLLTRGCLACHQLGNLGLSGLYGGGDLTELLTKRPGDFLTRWLADPGAINRDHRMPVFPFTADEMTSLGLWAKQQAAQKTESKGKDSAAAKSSKLDEGKKLVESLKCASCHSLSREKSVTSAADQKELTAASDWASSCLGEARREKGQPGYRLVKEDAGALRAYYSALRPGEGRLSQQSRGRDLLAQLNCLDCHQREGVERRALAGIGGPAPAGAGLSHPTLPALQDKLAVVAEAHGELAPLVPAMTPPALNSVGDKLVDTALEESITRKGPPHRPYLLVQMPKFELSREQLAAVTAYFVGTDRIPDGGAGVQPARQITTGQRPTPQDEARPRPVVAALGAAGPRLVTTDGLACTSCHQVGSVLPTKAPLNARGPDMSMLGQRIRREWFDRWCNNPARIVPRMEMPAVKIPVRGVLNDNVEDQLAAVWHILNTPGFEPPEPDPVRVLRLSGIPEKNERPIVIHDVVKDGDKTYLFPLVIGLPNRHNVLFDLETNRLAAWWLGDTARQRTKGKSWHWEMGGKSILEAPTLPEISIKLEGLDYLPTVTGQFSANLESVLDQTGSGESGSAPAKIYFACSTTFRNDVSQKSFQALVSHGFALLGQHGTISSDSIYRTINVHDAPSGSQLQVRFLPPEVASAGSWNRQTRTFHSQDDKYWVKLTNVERWNGDGSASFLVPRQRTSDRTQLNALLTYGTDTPIDQFVNAAPPTPPRAPIEIQIAPGFHGQKLPLPDDIMPSGLAWMPNSRFAFCTLKGQVYSTNDSNNDGLEDECRLLADGLASPYGLSYPYGAVYDEKVPSEALLVGTKTGLILLSDGGSELRYATHQNQVVTRWGHTDDYHDWAVGPVPGEKREFYLALPCQQDQRSDAAANYRGKLLKLRAQLPTKPREKPTWDIEVISAGHRFPMGMARNREGELFVTDNQGNYNPFNELNHVKKGAHFGFINALEKEKGFTPPALTEPAINIPHPWTRSVNGICFLETPANLVGWNQRAGRAPAHQEPASKNGGPAPAGAGLSHPTTIYGPLEGHLIGCEYDTRRLIRMSLDKVNGEYQGCCYPLSIPPEDVEKGLLGPIVCAIKPTTGELYVGEIRDSGWGASNNIGQITKIKIEPEKMPCGIAEVRATQTGFAIDFFQPVDKAKAADVASYSIESYRRESTPAYGGPDIDRRPEKIAGADVAEDGKRVTLTLPELRTRHVYELRLKNLAAGDGMFHPDEAHYTLKQIPSN